MDEVAAACPPACNNSDAHGRAIYVGAVADPGGGTTYACSSPPLGCRATADAAVGLMQAVLAPERLSPLPSHTLRLVFVQEFFFFLFSAGHSSSLCIHLLVKMISEQRTSPWLRSRPSRPRLPRLQGAIICMWYSSVSTPVTAFTPLRRCNCGGCQFIGFLPSTYSLVSPSVVLPL
jgi:hypothetical protein